MSYDHRGGRSSSASSSSSEAAGTAVGKRSLTGALQLKSAESANEVTNFRGLVSSTIGDRPQVQLTAAPSGGESFLDSLGAQSIAAQGLTGSSTAVPYADQIQASFGRHSIAGVSAHVGGPAAEASAALGANAYATGSSVAFGRAPDLHTAAHEAAHVVQQRAGVHLKGGMGEVNDTHERHADAVADAVVRGESAEHLLDQYSGGGGSDAVQCSFDETRAIPGGVSEFAIKLDTHHSTAPAFANKAGMDGYIRFVPKATDVNSNTITIVQIGKLVDASPGVAPETDVAGSAVPAGQHPRGRLGDRGLRTDAHDGVEGGWATDLRHDTATAGTATSPRYPVQPAPAGTTGGGGTVQQPPQYGGGTGAVAGQTPGFKRSDLPEDMKAVAMYDFPGVAGNTWNLDFEFQSVARGEDTQHNYGSVNWKFGLRAGTVVNEHLDVVAGASATFGEALERHRDFYVHEPVTIYFAFDDDAVAGAELAKVTGLAEYLRRNPRCLMTLDGFADNIGNAAYNVNLSQRRVTKTRDALIAAHATFPSANIVANTVVAGGGHGASNDATEAPASDTPAGTGDQGGNAANGADQTREANRQFNRRVAITFTHPTGTGPTAPGGVAAPP